MCRYPKDLEVGRADASVSCGVGILGIESSIWEKSAWRVLRYKDAWTDICEEMSVEGPRGESSGFLITHLLPRWETRWEVDPFWWPCGHTVDWEHELCHGRQQGVDPHQWRAHRDAWAGTGVPRLPKPCRCGSWRAWGRAGSSGKRKFYSRTLRRRIPAFRGTCDWRKNACLQWLWRTIVWKRTLCTRKYCVDRDSLPHVHFHWRRREALHLCTWDYAFIGCKPHPFPPT